MLSMTNAEQKSWHQG